MLEELGKQSSCLARNVNRSAQITLHNLGNSDSGLKDCQIPYSRFATRYSLVSLCL